MPSVSGMIHLLVLKRERNGMETRCSRKLIWQKNAKTMPSSMRMTAASRDERLTREHAHRGDDDGRRPADPAGNDAAFRRGQPGSWSRRGWGRSQRETATRDPCPALQRLSTAESPSAIPAARSEPSPACWRSTPPTGQPTAGKSESAARGIRSLPTTGPPHESSQTESRSSHNPRQKPPG